MSEANPSMQPNGQPYPSTFVTTRLEDMERLRDRNVALEVEVRRLREVVRWVAAQEHLFFAECAQAEEIVRQCRVALASTDSSTTGGDK